MQETPSKMRKLDSQQEEDSQLNNSSTISTIEYVSGDGVSHSGKVNDPTSSGAVDTPKPSNDTPTASSIKSENPHVQDSPNDLRYHDTSTALSYDNENGTTYLAQHDFSHSGPGWSAPYRSLGVVKTSGPDGEDKQNDLLPQIRGMFRLLDLYSESGSGGLVDKVIIDQDSLRSLINVLHPDACQTVTRIDFASLDQLSVKIIGVYGSKDEIVRFLKSHNAIDDRLMEDLVRLSEEGQPTKPTLRSGLYFLFAPDSDATESPIIPRTAYILYWPEDTTWNDDAIGAVKKNRVTFMRYLTRLTDQLVALISPDHESKLVWKSSEWDENQAFEDLAAEENDDSADFGRLFEFEVVVKKEQEEGAVVSPGFKVDLTRQSAFHNAPRPSLFLDPKLVASTSRQAILTGRVLPASTETRHIEEGFTEPRFRGLLSDFSSIYIEDEMTPEAVRILLQEGGLQSKTRELEKAWQAEVQKVRERLLKESNHQVKTATQEVEESRASLTLGVRAAIIKELTSLYPCFEVAKLYSPRSLEALTPSYEESLVLFQTLINSQPTLHNIFDTTIKDANLKLINAKGYLDMKRRFLGVQNYLKTTHLSPIERKVLAESLANGEPLQPSYSDVSKPGWGVSAMNMGRKVFGKVFGAQAQEATLQAPIPFFAGPLPPDPEFFGALQSSVGEETSIAGEAKRLEDFALSWAQAIVAEKTPQLVQALVTAKLNACKEAGQRDLCGRERKSDEELFFRFRNKLREALTSRNGFTLRISHIARVGRYYPTILVKARYEISVDPSIQYDLRFFDLTEDDRQRLQEDPQFVPDPKIMAPVAFSLPLDFELRGTYLLGKNRSLLIVYARRHIHFYLGDCQSLGRGPETKRIPYPGNADILFAVDENKRILAMAMMEQEKLTLQLFAFDELFMTMQSRGSPLPVSQWYQDGPPKILAICFIAGTEDLCILEKSGRIRCFSFISQAFRPATIELHTPPSAFFCVPDGSALIAVESSEGGFVLRVFHTATFGVEPQGAIPSQEPIFVGGQHFSITSLENRNNVHVLGLCITENISVQSVSLKISNKTTDFQYHSKGERKPRSDQKSTIHNSLIDCLSNVWERYPVVPAIKKEPISPDTRLPRSITYVSSSNHDHFRPYFKEMIREFEESTHKPTERFLDSIAIRAMAFHDVLTILCDRSFTASSFRMGEWVVELLCLIPIHIAIARDNRFVPLNNGIIDASLEQRLLGADVSQIVNALHLGWYESIFNSYMATKPVKVVSSMGEQSVGKSYALNHIVDSSFAGSAVRTTEGVWLSLCSTRDMLVVALDFEGVHSIERTPQEDMLLVLFNTAISNMVIFRNNFALNRDVANMFTSFQSSTSILDPASNPKLFKGILVVVIKDVVEADKNEIVKEFRSKFTQIVSDEQGTNFISVLHGGQTLIAPWPVIQSREFYSLFSNLKKRLLQQPMTHPSAGEFLLTLKTLMAKLKAQDWGAIDQNMAKHRVNTLLGLLPTALATGFGEVEPVPEPLKNLETQTPVPDFEDSYVRFCLSKSSTETQACLSEILSGWNVDPARHDMGELGMYLRRLVDARISHVQDWLTTNVTRFPSDNADVRALKRGFEEGCDKLRLSVQVCLVQCSSCNLPCILNRLHDQSEHNCGTSHYCLDQCQFIDEHSQSDPATSCGLAAGHGGRHMCNPTAHCCGAPCELSGKKGCQRTCNKVANHEDGLHFCSARIHQCGKACDLQDLRYQRGQNINLSYSCPNPCSEPHDAPHEYHVCDQARSCPIQCELCPRLCASADHFHGLKETEAHLCGQEHQCSLECSARGICRIETEPRSVETTFTGAYETFQYTKYTQVAKRLPCAIPILPGERTHSGPHLHSTDLFHHCEASCPNCGYICTLPLGHPQPEHETSHGSMDYTAWAIEGAPDTVIELQGRKYAPQDAGAPHLCNLLCAHQGRHAHIDYCRAESAEACPEGESTHIDAPMLPHPERPKDWVSHALFWKRTGFRDPYSREEQAEFALCDAECAGPDHLATNTQPANPSFCILPIFHPPQLVDWQGQGYVSSDGHEFACTNPNNLRQAFHVIFVLDKSSSMSRTDRRPLPNTPGSILITRNHDNRLGAVCSALEAFWLSRHPAGVAPSTRRDSYSVIAFDRNAQVTFANDFTSGPDQLLLQLLTSTTVGGGTNFSAAIELAQTVMEQYWSTDLSPVVIFLSDGEGAVDHTNVHDLCNRAIALGKPLSFHAVSFGKNRYSRSLRQMVEICNQVSQNAPRVNDPLAPLIPSSYSDAIDTIRLAEVFLTIAESLKKSRAGLIRSYH